MVWIGGAPGAGKSTIARDLARRTDLPLHPIDLWTYDHVGRMPPLRPLAEDLAEGPEFAAQAFVKIAAAVREPGRLPAGAAVAGGYRAGRAAAVPVRVRMRAVGMLRDLAGYAGRVRRTADRWGGHGLLTC